MKRLHSPDHNVVILLFVFLTGFAGAYAQQHITGTVMSQETDLPLEGAAVSIVGTQLGVLTNAEGGFSLEVPKGAKELLISYVGYEKIIVPIKGNNNLTIGLKASQLYLDDVVVIGYGTRERRKITSSISSLDETVFEGVPETNFQTFLDGRIPGLIVTQNSGLPGSSVTLRVRGPGSINADNQPLIVVDGMIMTGLSGFNLGSGGSNPLANINPSDIESVEVLKDAAASSIYGSQGANGVIIVTTKSGKFDSKPKVNMGYYAGISEATNFYDLLNGQEYAQYANQALEASGEPPLFDVATEPSTDWLDLVTRKGFVQSIHANVSGGSQNTQYYLSGSFLQEESYYIETGLKRYNIRANIEQLISEKVKIGLSIAPSRSENHRPIETGFSAPKNGALLDFPNVEAFDSKGNPIPVQNSQGFGYSSSPLIDFAEQNDLLNTTQLLLNSHITYSPIPTLTLKTEFATEFTYTEEIFRSSSRSSWGSSVSNGYGDVLNENLLSYNWTSLATYAPTLGSDHSLDLSLGANFIENKLYGTYTAASGFASDNFNNLDAAANPLAAISYREGSTFAGYFLRSNYDFQNKYLLTISARVDGSSRFGINNRYGFFPAISGGWIISKETFMTSSPFTFLKLRASFGIAGNAGISDYAAVSAVSPNSPYRGNPGSQITQFANEDLSWEKNQQWDVGLEFSIWKDRLKGTFAYYQKDTRDLLLDKPIPGTSGLSILTENVGAMRNQGFEYEVSADILRGAFRWNIGLNGATLKNEILHLADSDNDGEEDEIIGSQDLLRPGESAASFYLVRYAGVNPDNGDALFWDLDGNKTPDYSSSYRVIVGKPLPDFTGGFNQSLSYKGFELFALFKFAVGYDIYRWEAEWLEDGMRRFVNQHRTQLNSWTQDNTVTDIPEARAFQTNGSQPSTRFLDKGDYLRLKNLKFSYSFTPSKKSQTFITLYASAQNLLTITSYSGIDPEANSSSPGSLFMGGGGFTSPQARKIVLGFTMTL